jgi:hypothetical protein
MLKRHRLDILRRQLDCGDGRYSFGEKAAEEKRRQDVEVRYQMINAICPAIAKIIHNAAALNYDADATADDIAQAIIDGKLPGVTYTQPTAKELF